MTIRMIQLQTKNSFLYIPKNLVKQKIKPVTRGNTQANVAVLRSNLNDVNEKSSFSLKGSSYNGSKAKETTRATLATDMITNASRQPTKMELI